MLYRKLFWDVWFGLLLLAGSSVERTSPKKVIGILGESATFPLQSPKPFDVALWFRNETQVAVLRKGPSCELKLLNEYGSRDVTVSQDCSSLTVRGLREEDSAGYKALMLNNDVIQGSQTFILKVYKHLSEADLKVVCAKGLSDGNETLHLNCSVGTWEDGVNYSWTWTSSSQRDTSSSEKSLVLFYKPQDDDRNVTCVAKNPVGNVSRTVSLKQTCVDGKQPTRRPPTVTDTETGNEGAPTKTAIIVAIVVLVLVVVASAGIWTYRRNKTAVKEDFIASSSSSGPNESKSVYTEIQTVPEDMGKGRPQKRKGPGANKEMPTTIYAEVQHLEKILLQTDDEKRRAAEKGKKTIYSEISNLEETTEEALKTIYDTVTHPRPPEASEYDKIL